MAIKHRAPIHAVDVEGKQDNPRINLTRRKRGPAKKHISREEQALRALTPKMRDLAEGRLRVEDLDWEELVRGELRDSSGRFPGRAQMILPRTFHEQIAKEIIVRAESQFRQDFSSAMHALQKLVTDPKTPARERLAASQYVIERVMGKLTDKTEVKTEVTVFERAIQNGEFLMDLGEIEK